MNRPRIAFDQDERQYIDSLEVENTDQTIDEVLIEAYEDLYREHYTETVEQALKSGNLTNPAQLIAMIALRWHYQKETNIIDTSFLWKVYNLIDQHDFHRSTRSDIINELVRAGCVASENGDIYILPGLTELPDPERYLPQIKIVEPENEP